MKGTSMDNETVAAFMTSLEASPMIRGVELKQTRLVEGGGLKLVDFEIQSRSTRAPQKKNK
jgi:Tfp pilus assembly protein PilN